MTFELNQVSVPARSKSCKRLQIDNNLYENYQNRSTTINFIKYVLSTMIELFNVDSNYFKMTNIFHFTIRTDMLFYLKQITVKLV